MRVFMEAVFLAQSLSLIVFCFQSLRTNRETLQTEFANLRQVYWCCRNRMEFEALKKNCEEATYALIHDFPGHAVEIERSQNFFMRQVEEKIESQMHLCKKNLPDCDGFSLHQQDFSDHHEEANWMVVAKGDQSDD